MNTYIVTMSDGGEEVRIKAGAMTVEDNVYCFGDTKGVPLNRPMWVLLGSSPGQWSSKRMGRIGGRRLSSTTALIRSDGVPTNLQPPKGGCER